MKFSLLFLLSFLLACNSEPPPPAEPSFYFWKTKLKISQSENALLDSVGAKKLYVKFLDIARDEPTGLPVPSAMLELADTQFLAGKKIVPCVFITNETFRGLDDPAIEDFSKKTAHLLGELAASFPKNPLLENSPEIQFDCDWTASTCDQFFQFLKKVKTHLPPTVRLSATVRLHQFRSPAATGVPPVERGMLMFYNTGDIENWETENSIFSIAEAEKFVPRAAKKYPLPLDLALPAFSWTVVFRDGEFFKILPNRRHASDFSGSKFFKQLKTNRFEVVSETFCDGIFLRAGDLLRVEEVSPEVLREAADLSRRVPFDGFRSVAFFHLDSAGLAGFRAADFYRLEL